MIIYSATPAPLSNRTKKLPQTPAATVSETAETEIEPDSLTGVSEVEHPDRDASRLDTEDVSEQQTIAVESFSAAR